MLARKRAGLGKRLSKGKRGSKDMVRGRKRRDVVVPCRPLERAEGRCSRDHAGAYLSASSAAFVAAGASSSSSSATFGLPRNLRCSCTGKHDRDQYLKLRGHAVERTRRERTS